MPKRTLMPRITRAGLLWIWLQILTSDRWSPRNRPKPARTFSKGAVAAPAPARSRKAELKSVSAGPLRAFPLTPRFSFSGVVLAHKAPEPLERFSVVQKPAEAVATWSFLLHAAEAGC